MHIHRYNFSWIVKFIALGSIFFAVLATQARAEQSHWDTAPKFADVTVVNQDGEKVKFYSDLVKGKTVAINFIYTNCTTVCPTLTAILRNAQINLPADLAQNTKFISISIDPINDRPEVLKQYAAKFGIGHGWTFVTGRKQDIDTLLRSMGAYTASKDEHQPLILIGNDKAKTWTRSYGIPSSAGVGTLIKSVALKQSSEANLFSRSRGLEVGQFILAHDVTEPSGHHAAASDALGGTQNSQNVALKVSDAARYFTNLPLLTQDGKPVQFYNDMIHGKIVVINTMFTHCTMICTPMTQNLAKLQDYLGADWAQNVHIVSITVDPEHDPPEVLKEYANQFHANPQWTFLTGKKENIDWILYKLGAYTEKKDEHYSLLIVGNESTGAWLKVFALAKPQDIAEAVKELATNSKN